MNFLFTRYSKFYYLFSGILIAASVASLVVFGLKFGIEFTGGGEMEVEFKDLRPGGEDVSKALLGLNLGDISFQPLGEKGAVLRFKETGDEARGQILGKINEMSSAEEKSFRQIGPSVGKELKSKTQIAVVVVLLAITLYIAFAFRKVSRPVASWKYGTASLVALFHDILIPLGVFSVLGKFYGAEITIPIIAALLTVLGFSVHDTIVIFDRIRENILRRGEKNFEETVNLSLNQTLGRSISTVATTLLALFALFFLGGQTVKYFSLSLIIGIFSGAYSSIFIAAPLLASWRKWSEKDGRGR